MSQPNFIAVYSIGIQSKAQMQFAVKRKAGLIVKGIKIQLLVLKICGDLNCDPQLLRHFSGAWPMLKFIKKSHKDLIQIWHSTIFGESTGYATIILQARFWPCKCYMCVHNVAWRGNHDNRFSFLKDFGTINT